MFDNEPEEVDFDSLCVSENLTSGSLSAYDCDSEGGDNWDDIGDEDSDGETRGTRQPGIMGLKFQLDAARAGELHHFLMDLPLTKLHSSEFHQ
jgi:hypothetical protein